MDTLTKELFTPERAAEVINKSNTRNRAISNSFVSKLVASMRSGEFKSLLSPPVKFYEDGALADGQHRLAAVAKCGQPYYFYVQRGVKAEDGRVLDIGRNRSSADRLTVRGVKRAKDIAAIARAAIVGARTASTVVPAAEVERVAFNHQEKIAEWVSLAKNTNALVAAVFMQACETHAESRLREIEYRLLNRIQTGRYDPVTQIRRLIDDKVQYSGGSGARATYYGKVASCLQAALDDRECKQVKVLASWPPSLT